MPARRDRVVCGAWVRSDTDERRSLRQVPAFIAALPRELKELVRGWEKRELSENVFVYTDDTAVAACAGMGAARATLAVQAALSVANVTALISVGLAGACDPALRVGEIVHAGIVIDSHTGERFSDRRFEQILVTASSIASVREKRRLHETYRACAIDMEAAAVARLAQGHGIAFQAIKAISDATDFEIESLAKFATPGGQFREAAFGLHAALRPQLWAKVSQLARNSSKAVEALTAVLKQEIEWYRDRNDDEYSDD